MLGLQTQTPNSASKLSVSSLIDLHDRDGSNFASCWGVNIGHTLKNFPSFDISRSHFILYETHMRVRIRSQITNLAS